MGYELGGLMYFIATDSVVTYEFDARNVTEAKNHIKNRKIFFRDKEITLEYYKKGKKVKEKIIFSS